MNGPSRTLAFGERVTLSIYHEIPAGLMETRACDLHTVLSGPTLVHLPGRRAGTLFVSVLLHGNEDSGLVALQQILRRYADTTLPRPLSFFVGNVQAAACGLRRLDGQPDYNRVWPGTDNPDCAEAQMMASVIAELQSRDLLASVDIHNNTGLNPLYGCVTQLDARTLQLARLFSRTVVWFTSPRGVATLALAPLAPALTIECGKPGVPQNAARAAELVDALLHLSEFPAQAPAPEDLDVYHTVATVKVPDTVDFSMDGRVAPLQFLPELERLNFREMTRGEPLAITSLERPLLVSSEQGEDVFDAFLQVRAGRLELARHAMPAMLTTDTRVVRQDCLCYLMERVDPAHWRDG